MLLNGGVFRASAPSDRYFGGIQYGECIFESKRGAASLHSALEAWYGYSIYWNFVTGKVVSGFEA